MKKSTITDLPNDIISAMPSAEQNPLLKEIIEQARRGEFHDYKNKMYICGKMQLAQMLTDTNEVLLFPILEAVIDGVYDESPDEEDKAMMKKDWLEGGGTEESYNKMFGGN